MNKRIVVFVALVCLLLSNGFIYMNMLEIKKTVHGSKALKQMEQVNQHSLSTLLALNIAPLFFGSNVNAVPKIDVKGLIINVRDFGANGDGRTDDTEAIQAAVDSLKDTGGTVLMHGDFVSGNIKIPTHIGWITIELMGNWRLTDTLIIPPHVKLSGRGGSNAYIQFARRPQARLISPLGDLPTIKLTGMDSKIIENILINGSSGKAILLQNGALATLDNVAVLSGNKKTDYPLVIDSFFWVWIKDSVFASPPNGGDSVYITALPGSTMPQSGLVEIRNTIISGNGIKVAAERPIPNLGAIALIDVVYENGTTPFLMLDSTNAPIGGIQLDRILIADRRKVSSVIQLRNDSPYGVSNVFIRSSPPHPDMPLVQGGEIRGLFMDSSTNIIGARWDLGSQKTSYSVIRDGVFHGRWSGQGSNSAFNLVPSKPLNVNQDVSIWSKLFGLATVETGIRAPDGTLTAARLTSSSGSQGKRIFSQAFNNLRVGDWFIVGGWLKSESKTEPPYALSTFGFANVSNKFSHKTNQGFPFLSDVTGQSQQGWIPVVNAFQVSQISVSPVEVTFDLAVDKNHPTSFWKPFAIHTPASAGLSDDEIWRIISYMVPIPSDAPAGSFAMFPHQKLWGVNLIGSRGISATTTAAKNLRGSLTISDSAISGSVNFETSEPDANYFLTVTPTTIIGSAEIGSNRIRSIAKAKSSFTVRLEVPPGKGNSITFDWHLIR